MTGTGSRYPQGSRLPAGGRRWPELAVGALTLALVAGLGGLLLSERLKPEKTVSAEPAQVTPSAIPASPGAVTTAASAQQAPSSAQAPAKGAVQASEIPPAPAAPPVAEIPPPVLPEPEPLPQWAQVPPKSQQTEASPTSGAAAQPQTPAQTESAQSNPLQSNAAQAEAQANASQPTVGQSSPTQQSAAQEPPATPAQQAQSQQTQAEQAQDAQAAASAVTPRAGGAVAPSAQRTPLRSDYRVMLGTFANRGSLQAATASVSALGYTVYAIDLGNQFVAQVGPFADEATGQQAAADIRRVYGGATLYAPRGQQLQTPSEGVPAQVSEAAPQPVPDVSAPEAAATPPEAAVPDSLPAPSGPTYLQVGAFNNPEGAQRFVEQLRAQGFSPSVSAPATGKVTVVLGPLSGDALLATEQRLASAGFDSFRLR